MTDSKDKLIRNAQYRKGLSIAFFNATNSAVSMLTNNPEFYKLSEEGQQKALVNVRNWLLEEHEKYYAEVVARVGINYDAKDSIKKLKSVKTMDALKDIWVSFTEDERADDEIYKTAQAMKKKVKK